MLSIQPQSRLGLNKKKQTLCQNWGDNKKTKSEKYVRLFAMPAPVMWAKVLTGILASHFFVSWFWCTHKRLCHVSPSEGGDF